MKWESSLTKRRGLDTTVVCDLAIQIQVAKVCECLGV